MRIRLMAAVIIAVMLGIIGEVYSAPDNRPVPDATNSINGTNDLSDMPLCEYEDGSAPSDSLPCFWDARTSGNMTGRSYWIDQNENVHYVP